MRSEKKKLAVWKFTSCDGCQLTLIDRAALLVQLADQLEVAYFPEATSTMRRGRFDISLVEGSVSTPSEVEQIQAIRRRSRTLVAIGACATMGGVQAFRNQPGLPDRVPEVYARPEWVEHRPTSDPIRAHVPVDLELHGCPVDGGQLEAALTALLHGRTVRTPQQSVCTECKRRSRTCVMVARRLPCLGPVTQAGCGAICPGYDRACYGCFGATHPAPIEALRRRFEALGVSDSALDMFHADHGMATAKGGAR
jgi:coenzyme F420-reducing hydrogenase gamma subunit